jgi:hypothetical protein
VPLGLAPGSELAVEPDPAVPIVIGNKRHGTSFRRCGPRRALDDATPALVKQIGGPQA